MSEQLNTIDEWLNPDFATKWDEIAVFGNHTRGEQLDIILSILKKEYQSGKTILDLGIGSGQVTEIIFANIAEADIVGVDYSPAMLEIAQKRLHSFSKQYKLFQQDFVNVEKLSLPEKQYQIAITVQALHHIYHQHKKNIFKYIYEILENNGIFLISDSVAIDTAYLSSLYITLWERLEEQANVRSGWSGEYYLQRLPQKSDYPATIEEHLHWLRDAGFHASCLFLHLDRALIAAVKQL